MEEWKEYKVSDIIEEIAMGPFGSNIKVDNFIDFGVPVLNGSNLQGYKLNEDSFNYVSEEKADSLGRSNAYRGDIVITHRGTLGQIVYIPKDSKYERYVISQSQFRLKLKSEIMRSDFFAYYFHTRIGQHKIMMNASQVGVPALARPTSTFKEVTIPVPSMKTQCRIMDIILSIDDKIECNRRINENLEQQAQALFKSWFVDFEPFKDQPFVESELGMIPQGWKVVSLAELMDYAGGSQPPASEFIEEYRDGYIRFVQIRDYASDSHITYIPISSKNKLCDVKDIMIARYGASLGRICYGLKGAYNVALAKVYPTQEYYLEYLRCYLNTSEFYEGINQKGNRAVQAGFNKSDIKSFIVPFPCDESVVLRFNSLCSAMFEKRLANDIESRRLAELRDALLPKLMSGEIKVEDVTF